MYSRHCPWGSNTMARSFNSKNKQNQPPVSGSDLKNIKEQTTSKSRGKKEKREKEREGQGFRDSRKFEGDLAEFAKQLLLPIDVTIPRVSPSNYPVQVCSRHIHRVVDVSSATAAYANGFTVIMNPNLYAPGYISAPAAVVAPAVASMVSFNADINNDLKSLVGDVQKTKGTVIDTLGDTTHITLHSIADSAGLSLVGMDLAPGIHAMRMSVHVKSGGPIHWESWMKTAGGAWFQAAALSTHMGEYETADLQWTSPANCDALAFRSTGTTVSGEYKLSIVFVASQVIGNTGQTFSPAFPKFVVDNQVTHARVVSMSILATNTSPEIADGGNVNAGRVPKSFSPNTNVASELAALPRNRRYQGKAKDGAYVTWMPSQFDEFEIDTVTNKHEQLRDAEYLIVEVSGWNPPAGSTASFRLQFDWIIEFYTPNQLFEKRLTPPSTPTFQALYHSILSMDAATCNPGHLDQLKNLISSGISGFNRGMDFYHENEKVIHGVLSLLATMLA